LLNFTVYDNKKITKLQEKQKLLFWLNVFFGGVKHPDPTIGDSAINVNLLI